MTKSGSGPASLTFQRLFCYLWRARSKRGDLHLRRLHSLIKLDLLNRGSEKFLPLGNVGDVICCCCTPIWELLGCEFGFESKIDDWFETSVLF